MGEFQLTSDPLARIKLLSRGYIKSNCHSSQSSRILVSQTWDPARSNYSDNWPVIKLKTDLEPFLDNYSEQDLSCSQGPCWRRLIFSKLNFTRFSPLNLSSEQAKRTNVTCSSRSLATETKYGNSRSPSTQNKYGNSPSLATKTNMVIFGH